MLIKCPPLWTVSSLKIKQLNVPIAVEYGSDVTLVCDFDLEGETLYSVKWYKNLVEFYRFLPSNVPNSATAISMNGFTVEVSYHSRSEALVSLLLCSTREALSRGRPFMPSACHLASLFLSISHAWWAFPFQRVDLCSGCRTCRKQRDKGFPGHLLPSWLRRKKKQSTDRINILPASPYYSLACYVTSRSYLDESLCLASFLLFPLPPQTRLHVYTMIYLTEACEYNTPIHLSVTLTLPHSLSLSPRRNSFFNRFACTLFPSQLADLTLDDIIRFSLSFHHRSLDPTRLMCF